MRFEKRKKYKPTNELSAIVVAKLNSSGNQWSTGGCLSPAGQPAGYDLIFVEEGEIHIPNGKIVKAFVFQMGAIYVAVLPQDASDFEKISDIIN